MTTVRWTLLALSAATLTFVASAQPARPDFNRPQSFDAQHYVIKTSFDRTNGKVFGETTVRLKPLKGDFREVELDAVDLSFEWVRLESSGTELKYRTAPGRVIITLDRTYGPGEQIGTVLKYTAAPKKGVYFVPAAEGRSAQIWTQGEPDEARHWFPSFDFPSDKATTEQYLTVERGETVVGNGELIRKTENPDRTVTWHYKMPIPHSTYLVSFVIGKYSKVEDRYKDIPLGYYIYPGREATARKAYAETAAMMRVFEDFTGIAYPYNKYDQTVVAAFQFGGMENITATTMADTEIFFADFDFGKGPVTDLVSHELAHSWFGNLVTCRNWAELWLNEGFATFMEAAYREKAYGRADYMRKIRSDAASFLVDDTINRRRHALYNLRAGDVSALFDNAATTYHKGGAVVHTLREQVGDDAFWKGVNIYLNRHRFANVESSDLRKAMEEASGQELGWFFDQWVYRGGAPNLNIRPVYNSRSQTLTVTVSQIQRADANTPAVFRLPTKAKIRISSGETEHDMNITKRVQTFSFKIPKRPSGLTIDPEERIPIKRVKIRPIAARR